MAQGFYGSTRKIKAAILSMSTSATFPTDDIASAMSELHQVAEVDPKSNKSRGGEAANSFCFPNMTVAQTTRLDEVIDKIKVKT